MIEKQMTSGGEETKKLYYEDSHRKEFTATVLSCEERLTDKGKKDGYVVVLDQTAFFPEGGGQFGDRGFIDDVEVYDTHEKGGVILHYTKTPVEVGTTVTGKLDFAERFSRMQEHSGEHIVSGIVHRLHGYDNVGFHLGSEIRHWILMENLVKSSFWKWSGWRMRRCSPICRYRFPILQGKN